MPPIVIDVAKAEDLRDVVHRTVQALAEGQIVAVPTETVYGLAVNACCADAVARLAEVKGRSKAAPFAIALKSDQELRDYAPNCGKLARRLARRCWPGPVTLVVDADLESGLTGRLPESVRPYICPEQRIGLRTPANKVLQDVLRMIAGPIALTSANLSGQPEAVTAAQVVEKLGDRVALVLDDGPARYGQPSTVVRVAGGNYKVLREGVVAEKTLERMERYGVTVVCTGNTCRSPMAEALLRRRLVEKLGCKEDELEQRGVSVASAGIAASPGAPPSPEAVELMRAIGIDLSKHEAQMLTDHLIRQTDMLVTMTRAHRNAIIEHWPDAAERTRVLMPDGLDVADPIGGPLEVYRRCADQIEQGVAHCCEQIVADLGTRS